MATLMEKDVLLEYSSFGYLIPNIETKEIQDDEKAMGLLWNEILYTDEKDIDYKATIEKIKTLRSKYARG